MAKSTILVSDLSGEPIADGEHVEIRIVAGASVTVIDASVTEADKLFKNKGRVQAKRGAKPAEPVAAAA